MTGTGMNILHCRQTHSPLWSICESSSAISDEAARRSVRYWFDNLLRVEFRDAFHSSEESSSMIDSQNELMNDETWIFSCWNEIIWSSLWRCQLSVMSDDALWYFELSIFLSHEYDSLPCIHTVLYYYYSFLFNSQIPAISFFWLPNEVCGRNRP